MQQPTERISRTLQSSGVAQTLAVVCSAALAIVLVVLTGGGRSDYRPVLYVPIAVAMVAGRPLLTLLSGLLLSGAFLLIGGFPAVPRGPTRVEVMHAIIMNVIALAGALLSIRSSRESRIARRKAAQQEALLNASQIISSAERLEHATNSALLLLPRIVPDLRSAALFFADESRRHMELFDSMGVASAELGFDRFAVGTRDFGWHPGDPNPLYIPMAADVSAGRVARLDPGAGSCVCVGLRSLHGSRSAMGMLYASSESPNAFSPEALALLQEFADRIALPLQKIRVQEGLAGLAYTDALTGLHNVRYFRSHVEDEMKRAVRYSRPLSLIMLDLDDFKPINDRYGHPAGDKILADVAEIIRTGVRETDVPARYGGEEFVIISPETLEPEATVVAERIRSTVASCRFVLDTGEVLAITLSAGVATFPTDAQDEVGLLNAADAALYAAKRAGKNRTAAAQGLESAA